MNLLLLTSAYPNYVPDLLLQGLRKLFGPAVVDFPRKDSVYQGICGPPHLDPVPGFMADDTDVDRTDIEVKLARGFFDFVLVDVRAFNEQLALLQKSACKLALVDGEDFPFPIRPGPYAILRRETDGSDFSIPLPMALPAEVIDWIDRHADTAKTHSVGFLGSRSVHTPDRNAMLDALAERFPDSLVDSWAVGNSSPGRDGYYRNLQSCRVVLNLPGAGWDTFRYWENAACNAMHACKTMPLFVPQDFRDGVEITRFETLADLIDRVERVMDGRLDWRAFGERSRAWLRQHHTTEIRAKQTIDRLRRAYGIAL